MVKPRAQALAALLSLAFAAPALHSCGGRIRDSDRLDRPTDSGLETLFVTITAGDLGTPERPIPFGGSREVTVRIEGRDRNNNVAEQFNGFVNIAVTPAVLESVSAGPSVPVAGRTVQLTNGVADGVRVRFVRGYGEVRVWVEEAGYDPVDPGDPMPPLCANGLDDDGDGLVDFPADYGCNAPNDDSERGGSYALGASEAIYVDSPTVDDVNGPGGSSPLINERVSITKGTLIVTRISPAGFWVTDTARTMCSDPSNPGAMRRCSNSLFSFNFRLPEGMRPCDRLEVLQGTVQEFTGTTQFAQPAWDIPAQGLWIDEATSGRCPIPEPVEIRATELADSQTLWEPLENGLVRANGVRLSTNIGPAHPNCQANGSGCTFAPATSNCDFNDDGRVDFDDAREGGCANTCQQTIGCSEWSNWSRFGQIAVDFSVGQMAGVQRLNIAPRTAISDFDPLRPPFTATTNLVVTGTIKQVGPNWIIEPRCGQDLVLEGRAQPTNATCLQPRSVTEEP